MLNDDVPLLQGRPAMMPDFQKDYEAGRRLLSDNGLPVFEAPIHLEGGSIHSDGQGTMVVTEECLLDPSRNPELGREGIEQVCGICVSPQADGTAPWHVVAVNGVLKYISNRVAGTLCLHSSSVSVVLFTATSIHAGCMCPQVLKDYLGLEKIIWLWRGMEGDTEVVNGHVDNMCCFIRPGVVALAWSDNEDDPQVGHTRRTNISLCIALCCIAQAERLPLPGWTESADAPAQHIDCRLD